MDASLSVITPFHLFLFIFIFYMLTIVCFLAHLPATHAIYFTLEMGKNPKLWVLVRVRVLSKAGSVRVRVLCLPSKFGVRFGFLEIVGSVRVRVLSNCTVMLQHFQHTFNGGCVGYI
jgi:hypothetical protein